MTVSSVLVRRVIAAGMLYAFTITPGAAQQNQPAQQNPEPAIVPPAAVGQVAESSVGRTGQRQTREDAAANIEPMGRINDRVANRVQNRIRNRIDRYYNPQANSSSPFEIAADQARQAGVRSRVRTR